MQVFQWINSNAPALQALSGLLSFSVAVVTVPVLIRTMAVAKEAAAAAQEQARAAVAQVESARESSLVSAAHLEAAREAAAAEREHSRIIKQQTLASLRPVLAFVRKFNSYFYSLEVENQTDALAMNIRGWNGTPESPTSSLTLGQTILGGHATLSIDGLDYGEQTQDAFGQVEYNTVAPAFLQFESQDGRTFITEVANLNAPPLIQTFREI